MHYCSVWFIFSIIIMNNSTYILSVNKEIRLAKYNQDITLLYAVLQKIAEKERKNLAV